MPRRPRTREALLRAAQELVSEGHQDAAILTYAERAGVSVGSFYNHFGSREAIVEAAVDLTIAQVSAFLTDCVRDIADPRERMMARIRLYGRLSDSHPLHAWIIVRTTSEMTARRSGYTGSALEASDELPVMDHVPDFVQRAAVMAASGALERLLAVRLADATAGTETVDAMAVLIASMLETDREALIELATRPLPEPPR